MNILTLVLQAAPQQAPAGGGMSIWIMLALMFVVMWFFMIRPQRKQQKELEKFRNEEGRQGHHIRRYLRHSGRGEGENRSPQG